MKGESAHNSIYQTSDFILLVTMFLGFLIEYFLIWDWSLPMPFYLRIVIGIAVTTLGSLMIVMSKSAFNKASQHSEPGKLTTQIVQTGIYGKMRNPTYLGVSLVVLGLGVLFNFISWIFGSLIAAILMHFILIKPEEKYLLSKFPEEYANYMKKVRRWI